MHETTEIVYDPARARVEARRGGAPAGFVEFWLRADAAVLAYTEVRDATLLAPLVERALELLTVRGFRIVPLCPRVRAVLHARPDLRAGVDARFLDDGHLAAAV